MGRKRDNDLMLHFSIRAPFADKILKELKKLGVVNEFKNTPYDRAGVRRTLKTVRFTDEDLSITPKEIAEWIRDVFHT